MELVNPLQHSAACRSPKKDKRREAERFENPHQTHLRWLKHTVHSKHFEMGANADATFHTNKGV